MREGELLAAVRAAVHELVRLRHALTEAAAKSRDLDSYLNQVNANRQERAKRDIKDDADLGFCHGEVRVREDRKPLVAYLSGDGPIIIKYDDGSRTSFGDRAKAAKVIKEHGIKLYESWHMLKEVEVPER